MSFVTLVVISILFARRRPGRAEIAVGVGILIVYLMAWLRIGIGTAEERTHLFEYSLVAALVHEALLERRENWSSRSCTSHPRLNHFHIFGLA